MIKIICHYPGAALDIFPPSTPASTIIFAVDPEMDFPEFAASAARDATACLASWRKLDPQTVPVEAKASANYLNGMMARLESRKRGFDEAIMLDTQGFVAEGGMESVFIAKDNVLMTPAAGTILQSITRKSLLELASENRIESREVRLRPEQLFDADEVFLACTPFKVLPLRRIEACSFPGGSGPLTKTMAGMMQRVIDGSDPAFEEWRFPVA
jgi:branched-chain amino acid aminotransferase